MVRCRYIFGKAGTVERLCGTYDNPELLAIGLQGPAQPLYRVRIKQMDVWPEYIGHPNDTVVVEVYQPWLDYAETASNFSCEPPVRQYLAHPHLHGGDQGHRSRAEVEQSAVDSEGPERPYRRVVEAIKMVLMDKGLITPEGVRQYIEEQDMNRTTEALGAKMVAKAWHDSRYKGAPMHEIAAVVTFIHESAN